MRLLALCLSTLLVSLTVAAPTAGAQRPIALQSRKLVRVGIGGGITVPTKDFRINGIRREFDTGYNGQAFLLVSPPGLPIGLRVTATYNRLDFKDAQVSSGLSTGGDEFGQIAGGLANFTLHLPLGPIAPYVTGGLGALNFKSQVKTATGETRSESQTKFAVDGGAGLAIKLGRLDAFIEGRIANLYTEQGFIDTKSIEFVPVTFGIIF